MSAGRITVAALVEPLPEPGSIDADGILALEVATQDRPLALEGVLAEARSEVDGVVLVARDTRTDDRPVGMASARRQVDEVHVIRMAVDATWRRQGVGRALLGGLIDWARSRDAVAVVLEVRSTNVAAQELYAAAGFVVDGRRPQYYSDGEDALLWRLMLTGDGRG